MNRQTTINNKRQTSDDSRPTTADRRQTIMVTGGAGYIGSITTRELLNTGFNVVVLDNLERGHSEAVDRRAKLYVADLRNKQDIYKVFQENKIDAVIDFAAYIAVGESMEQPKKYVDNNVFNFINLIEVMLENGCKFLIKSSTASVYGNPTKKEDFPLLEQFTETKEFKESQLLTGIWEDEELEREEFFEKIISYCQNNMPEKLKLAENDRIKLRIPTSVYGLTKLLDEIIMKKYDVLSGLKYITLRYFNVAGAATSGDMGQVCEKPTHIFANAIFNLLGKNSNLEIFGNDYDTKDGTGVRDYIHVVDLATGHIAALNHLLKSQISDTINLGTGTGYSVLEVINAVERASGRKVKFSFGSKRSGDVAVVYANPSKAWKTLGWKSKYSLDDMAKTAWKWHSTHPNGYASGISNS